MFKTLKRQDRALSNEETTELLRNGKYGVLSLLGEQGYPYGVPIHYVLHDNCIYFHSSAQIGHKAEAIKENAKASFTRIETEDGIKSKSVICFGKVIMVKEKRQMVLEKMVERFVPEQGWEQAKKGIPYALDQVSAYAFQIEHQSGKWIDKPAGR